MSSIFLLLALLLVSVAHSATLSKASDTPGELAAVIRQTRRCTCQCFVSKRGRRLTRRLCNSGRRKIRCEIRRCTKGKAARPGLSCCRKMKKKKDMMMMAESPEPDVEE